LRNVRVLGFPMTAQSFAGAIDLLEGWGKSRPCRTVHFCTAHLLVEGRENPAVGASLLGGSMLAMDGMSTVWAARAAGVRVERVSGPDILFELIDRGRSRGLRHFFYGSTWSVLDDLCSVLQSRYPGVDIVGRHAPPFGPQTTRQTRDDIELINASGANVLWVGLGAPKQDLWVEANRDRVSVGVALAVGAAFDFGAGRIRRAPAWMQRLGLEWFFRLLMEPRRLWRRYVVTNAKFLLYMATRRKLRLGRRKLNRSGTPGR
jgi:N-acetylglucosaminyldiphosphoundecaprenol N-acetyl-beta-D-mannosaminyltransferase